MYNFKNVEAVEAQQNVMPGKWVLSISEAKYEKSQKEGKSSFLKVTFKRSNGEGVVEKFYITPKTFSRLQYFHTLWFNAKLEKDFPNEEAIGAYFEAICNSEKAKKFKNLVLVQGEISVKGQLWPKLPYTGFILSTEPGSAKEADEIAFVEDSAEWKMHVTVQKNAATASNSTILPDSSPTTNSVPDFDDDLPF